MTFMRQCCGDWTVKQGSVLAAALTLIGSILWLAWQTYQIMYLEKIMKGDGGPCYPNPCYHGGVCLDSEQSNKEGYVCDCLGTGFSGYNCNISDSDRVSHRSCAEWYREGYRQDGLYMIDPDGPDDHTLGPMKMKCEFTKNRANTVIEHTYQGPHRMNGIFSEQFSETNAVRGGGKFIQIKPYYLELLDNLNQAPTYIESVIKQSQHCEQSFVIFCSQWPIKYTTFKGGISTLTTSIAEYETLVASYAPGMATVPAAAEATVAVETTTATAAYDSDVTQAPSSDGLELDMSGKPYDIRDYTCTCWEEDTCDPDVEDNDEKCNCDLEEDSEFLNDTVVFNKRHHFGNLPITEVLLRVPASANADYKATVELSPLRCYDEFETLDPYSDHKDGGYGKRPARRYTRREREGYNIMWGVIIAFMVLTALLLVAAIVLMMGAILDSGPTLLFWVVMIILHNIMVFIVLVVRWYFLGFYIVVWELACEFVWMCLTVWGLLGVVAYFMWIASGQRP